MSLGSQPCCDASPFPYVELGELVEFRRGLTYGKSDEVEFSSTAVLRANNVDLASGQLDLSEIRYISDEVEVPRSKKLIANSLLICTASGSRSHLGKMAHVSRELDFAFGGFMGLLVPRSELSPKYLWYFSRSSAYREHLESTSPGANINNLRFDDLARLALPLPPLDEQKRIVAALDQAFAALDRARANAEANLHDTRSLFRSELERQFDAARENAGLLPFEAVCEPLTPRVKLKRQDYLDEGDYPVVSQEADLISGYWNDPTALMDIDGPVVVFGDHTCCLKYVDFDFVVGADGTKVLQPSDGISAKYLYYGLRSQPIQQSGYARHFKLLREALLPDLAMAEQDRLSDHLGEMEVRCDELSRRYDEKLEEIAELRNALLQAAFSGQLS